jgi:predicted permease
VVGFISGFATLVLPAILGYIARRRGIISQTAEIDLNRLVFYFALPAMTLSSLMTADLRALFGPQLAVQFGVCLVAIGLMLIANRVLPGRVQTGGPKAITVMAGFYANLGNMGMPIAIALFNDASIMVPFLLMQQIIFMPICLGILEYYSDRKSVV